MSTEQNSLVPKQYLPLSHKIAWVALMMLVVGVIAGAVALHIFKTLQGEPPPVFDKIPAFQFTDETSQTVTLETWKGNAWVADFVFTRCGGPCPMMSANMRLLQNWLEKDGINNVKLVSFTVDSDFDTPEVLKEYGSRFSANPQTWKFVTGDRAALYTLFREGFKVGVEKSASADQAEQTLIHTQHFVLVDQKGRIRGWYSADDTEAMKRLRVHIKAVAKEKQTP